METFLERLQAEQRELNLKIEKLSAFQLSNAFEKVDPIQKVLLVVQLDAMRTYNQVLIQRLQNLS